VVTKIGVAPCAFVMLPVQSELSFAAPEGAHLLVRGLPAAVGKRTDAGEDVSLPAQGLREATFEGVELTQSARRIRGL